MKKNLFGYNIDDEWEHENGFYITSHVTRISKMVAHYELYKSIINLPGQVVECGVFKGASLIRFCTFREILESQYSRKITGFDAFGKFQTQKCDSDDEFIKKFEKSSGDGISVEQLNDVLLYKEFKNYELVPGNIEDTVPHYVENNPEMKISLLHIDVDVYNPSKVVLDCLFDKVVVGGLIVLDDYGTVYGETRAVDEYLLDKDYVIEKMPISHIPSYIRKKM